MSTNAPEVEVGPWDVSCPTCGSGIGSSCDLSVPGPRTSKSGYKRHEQRVFAQTIELQRRIEAAEMPMRTYEDKASAKDRLLLDYANRLKQIYSRRTAGDYTFLGLLVDFLREIEVQPETESPEPQPLVDPQALTDLREQLGLRGH